MKLLLKMFLTLVLAFAGRSIDAAVLPVISNGVTWDYSYDPDVNPDPNLYDKLPTDRPDWFPPGTTPYWTYIAWAGSSQDVVDNYLRVTSTGDGDQLAWSQTAGWNGGMDTTLEIRLRVEQVGSAWAGMFNLSTGEKWGAIAFSQSTIGAGSASITGLDLSEWTVIRLTLTGGATDTPTVSIYINNSPVAAAVTTDALPGTTSDNQLGFGDFAGGDYNKGVVDYDYIRWTSEGAFAPVPEPSVAACLLIGFTGLVARRFLRVRSQNRQSV